MQASPRWILAVALVLAWLCAEPAAAETWDFVSPACERGGTDAQSDPRCRVPTIRVEQGEHAYNRIGTPRLYRGWLGGLRAWVDPAQPSVYIDRREDEIAGRPVVQLVYRFHFEKIPLRLSRYFFEAHRNPGMMLILTTDPQTGAVMFVSAVHTCGCYLAVVPTDAVDPAWLPEDWSEEQRLYGERLPGRLPEADVRRGLRVTLRSRGHRVMKIEAGDLSADADRRVEVALPPMQRLEALPIEGRDGETGSFFYTAGPLRGHVRGAWNMMEGLTVFGWLSLDPTVGMDKQLGDPDETGTRFYTQLPFWMHERSRLDQMGTLLRALGYRIP